MRQHLLSIAANSGRLTTREQLAQPGGDVPHLERLRQAGAIDLRDNGRFVVGVDGYARMVPVEPTKRYER